MWERLDDFLNDEFAVSARLKVPGGWIVRTTMWSTGPNGGSAVTQTFVEDSGHQWKLEQK